MAEWSADAGASGGACAGGCGGDSPASCGSGAHACHSCAAAAVAVPAAQIMPITHKTRSDLFVRILDSTRRRRVQKPMVRARAELEVQWRGEAAQAHHRRSAEA